MSKILTIGTTEYLTAVRSKAFIIGVIMMPVFMLGGLIVEKIAEETVDLTERNFAVVDDSGLLYEKLQLAVEKRNEACFEAPSDGDGGEQGEQIEPLFQVERYEHSYDSDESVELALSNQVRSGELFAFVVIGEDVFETKKKPRDKVDYYSAAPTYNDLPDWISEAIQGEVQDSRFKEASLDANLVSDLTRPITFNDRGLVERSIGGEEVGGKEENKFQTFAVPIASMMLLFMLLMMSAPQALNVVLEEKMQKISEVLVSAVTPFQLMMGKLLGTVYLAMTLSALYIGAITIATYYFGVSHLVEPQIYLWFFLFLLMALAIYTSIFSAIGAACSEMRDAQTLMTPAMVVLMIPMFFIGTVLDSPNSTMSAALSMFPPATPMLMMLRVAIAPGPPMWQLIMSLVLTSAFTAGCVWAAGKVFRIGLLSSGQAPTMKNLIGWVFSK